MKKFLLVIGVLLLINAIFLFLVTNFNLGTVLQGFVAGLIIIYALCFDRLVRSVHIIGVILCVIPLIFMTCLAIYGNCDNTQYNEDVVIVLGAGIRGEQVSITLARRLDEAVNYYHRNPRALIIVCGGQGFQESIPEALAMERYLIAKGIPPAKIIKEEKSTSTYENFSFAREILNNYFPQGFSSVLITNDFHVYRATKLARYAGISAGHIGAYTEWYTIPVNYLREMLAVVKMWVMPPQGALAAII